jgi:hypothetical protein
MQNAKCNANVFFSVNGGFVFNLSRLFGKFPVF